MEDNIVFPVEKLMTPGKNMILVEMTFQNLATVTVIMSQKLVCYGIQVVFNSGSAVFNWEVFSEFGSVVKSTKNIFNATDG